MDVLSSVFNRRSSHHSNFKPVLDWIVKGKGFLVYGGTLYNKQLKNAGKYHGVVLELKKKGKVKTINKDLVDEHQKLIDDLICDTRCNDSHLIAIFQVSGCRLLCSKDSQADTYIKNKNYYLDNQKPPKIYRSYSHRHLLCSANIVSIRNCL